MHANELVGSTKLSRTPGVSFRAHRAVVIGVLSGLVLAMAPFAPDPLAAADERTETYSSCRSLRLDYPNGVAASRAAARKAIAAGFERPAVDRATYRANFGRLDDDYNGVVCERISAAQAQDTLTDWFESALCDRLAASTPLAQMPAYCAKYGYS